MSQDPSQPPVQSPVVPNLLGLNDTIQFNCYQGISCFNACCKQADITLAPYDIIRLKTRLGMTSTEFLKKHTVPFEMDASGMPGVKLRTTDEEPVCLLMSDEGCSVYDDRPSACRYYPVGLMTMRATDAPREEHHYCLVEESHCQGHKEGRKISVADYRKEQGVEPYDDMNREWYQIILKRRSAGPAVGKPSPTSFQFFFLCSYDVDRFREFTQTESFRDTYVISDDEFSSFDDDVTLLKFGYRLMMQVLFGEESIALRQGAVEERIEKRREIYQARHELEVELHRQKQDPYQSNGDS